MPFILKCDYQNRRILIQNIKTGRQSIIINDLGINFGSKGFFKSLGNSILELHFTTSRSENSEVFEQSWYRMDLNQDFWEYLSKYGYLPSEMTVKELMDQTEKCEEFKGQAQTCKIEVEELKV